MSVAYADDVQVERLLLVKDLDRGNPRVEVEAYAIERPEGRKEAR